MNEPVTKLLKPLDGWKLIIGCLALVLLALNQKFGWVTDATTIQWFSNAVWTWAGVGLADKLGKAREKDSQ